MLKEDEQRTQWQIVFRQHWTEAAVCLDLPEKLPATVRDGRVSWERTDAAPTIIDNAEGEQLERFGGDKRKKSALSERIKRGDNNHHLNPITKYCQMKC
jgi:hypothetical protein